MALFESRSEAEVEFAIFRQLLTTSEDDFSIAEMAGGKRFWGEISSNDVKPKLNQVKFLHNRALRT